MTFAGEFPWGVVRPGVGQDGKRQAAELGVSDAQDEFAGRIILGGRFDHLASLDTLRKPDMPMKGVEEHPAMSCVNAGQSRGADCFSFIPALRRGAFA